MVTKNVADILGFHTIDVPPKKTSGGILTELKKAI